MATAFGVGAVAVRDECDHLAVAARALLDRAAKASAFVGVRARPRGAEVARLPAGKIQLERQARGVREIDIGFARAWCVRITYVGELGYELYIPAEQALHVYDRIIAAGAPFNLVHAGLKALSSLRLEKGYRDYGHDIDNTDDPDSAGLGFALDMKKPEGFIGKEAVLARRARGALTRRLVQVFVQNPIPLMFHSEVVRRDGIPVGYVRAGSYGHTLGGAVGLAMIDGQGSAAERIHTHRRSDGLPRLRENIIGQIISGYCSALRHIQ